MNSKLNKGYFFSGFLLVLLFASFFSCNGGLEDTLIGSWSGSDFLFQRTEGPDLVATVNGGLDQHLHSKFIIKDDGTYEKLVDDYDNGNGIWELRNDSLIIRSDNGNQLKYKLLKVTEKELVTVHDVTFSTPPGEIKGKITLTYTR